MIMHMIFYDRIDDKDRLSPNHAVKAKGLSFLAIAMHIALSCIAPLELLRRESMPYIRFNDEASSKG